jgi:hypothetical protein
MWRARARSGESLLATNLLDARQLEKLSKDKDTRLKMGEREKSASDAGLNGAGVGVGTNGGGRLLDGLSRRGALRAFGDEKERLELSLGGASGWVRDEMAVFGSADIGLTYGSLGLHDRWVLAKEAERRSVDELGWGQGSGNLGSRGGAFDGDQLGQDSRLPTSERTWHDAGEGPASKQARWSRCRAGDSVVVGPWPLPGGAWSASLQPIGKQTWHRRLRPRALKNLALPCPPCSYSSIHPPSSTRFAVHPSVASFKSEIAAAMFRPATTARR